MLRQVIKGIPSKLTPNITPIAQYQNNVTSDALEHLERFCNRRCPIPRFPPQKVAVIGAGSDVGHIISLFLKQQKLIKVLSLYDEPYRGVLGMATDLAHVDTSTEVEAYQGRMYLKDALYNMQHVRTVSLACAQFCPHAVVVVQTPPVDCNFTLCKHTLEVARAYDKRRVLGMNSINAMRANQLYCSLMGTNPATTSTPVVGGTGRCTRVPVFSVAKAGNFPQTQVECLTRLVREADEIICRVKSNNEQGHLSIGFATARCVVNIMKGLFEKPTLIDSALVEQADPKKCYDMDICATPVKIGQGGIVEYAIPDLNKFELTLLEESRCDLTDMLSLGRSYALGDDYHLHDCRFYSLPACKPCPTTGESKKDKVKQ